jgi:hypothetical protein
MEVLQRRPWDGQAREIDDLFRLKKNRRVARAAIFSHPCGWELRLLVGKRAEVLQIRVCRSQEEVLSIGEEWRAAMAGKGWE